MSTSSELETKILEDFLHYFLPEGLLDYFEPVMAEDKEHQIKQDEVYKRILHLYFDERDNRPAELQHLRPNGTKFSDEFAEFLKKNLGQTPVTAKSLGRSYMIDAGTLEHAYKYTWSGFLGWEQRSHADNWVLLPDNLGEWYQAVADCTIREIKSARDAIKSREENVLNYFIDRSTNASAESFNSKLKAFRAQLRGIRDLPFFIFRICKVFG